MEILLLSVLGGILALDATGLGQTMISRPLVAGTLAGAAVGDPLAGLAVGAVLELLVLPEVPVGGGRVPEGWLGALAAAVAAPLLPATVAGRGTAVLFGLVWALVGGLSLPLLRRWNSRLLPDPGQPRPDLALDRSHRVALVLDFLRGASLAALAVLTAGAVTAGGAGVGGRGETGVSGVSGIPGIPGEPGSGALTLSTLVVALLLAASAGVSAGAVLARSGRTPRAGFLFLVGVGGGAMAVFLL